MGSASSLKSAAHERLLGLMLRVKDGDDASMIELKRQISKYKNPKSILKHLASELRQIEERCEKLRLARARAREKNEPAKFPATHPLFRKARATKGAGKSDAFDYRVVLCGGFETNRRRH